MANYPQNVKWESQKNIVFFDDIRKIGFFAEKSRKQIPIMAQAVDARRRLLAFGQENESAGGR